jgi:hypothetical protein
MAEMTVWRKICDTHLYGNETDVKAVRQRGTMGENELVNKIPLVSAY